MAANENAFTQQILELGKYLLHKNGYGKGYPDNRTAKLVPCKLVLRQLRQRVGPL